MTYRLTYYIMYTLDSTCALSNFIHGGKKMIANTLAEISGFLVVILIIVGIVMACKGVKKSRSRCPKCKRYYFFDEDIKLAIGDLKWERKTKKETRGDFEYEVSYKTFYRLVDFFCTCPNCKSQRAIRQRFDVYDSDSNFSQSHEEEMRVLENKIKKFFAPCIFNKELQTQQNNKLANKKK